MTLFDNDPRFERTSTQFGFSYSNGHAKVHYDNRKESNAWTVDNEAGVSEDYAYEMALDAARG